MALSSSHKKRIGTGLMLVVLWALSITFRGWSEFALLTAIAAGGLWEFFGMFWSKRRHLTLKISGLGLGTLILLAGKWNEPWLILAALVAAFWVCNLWFLKRYSLHPEDQSEEYSYGQSSVFITGLLYVPVLLQFLFGFERMEIVLVLLAVLASDTGAFYAGSLIGGPKVWPMVSPKKTWAGSMGGMVASIMVCLAAGAVDEYWLAGAGAGRPWWMWALLGIGLNISAQFGDFFESALKRRLHVKDSGTLLPGHGGILDRIDSLLLAVATYAGLDALFNFFR
ncbi:phosphatidate cytidylyltransferase [Desulfovibrio ferrophilus]|uniref:Phosphatidate cytidylyltransferase n=1 Tax=Desulfovibrio ferrophilus TaxID=241368 RepID=A0A2Z6AZD2_9BACT|nr:phosphatidate cytidylyltransferase [Desulfovibrio ferrophilus]BBD08631.1 phosphatidate cytidylyltransferase [Desulfovibrio ferrophilus]